MTGIDDQKYNIRNVVSLAVPKIFDFAYPIYESEYNFNFEFRFLHHYYFQEIAFETYSLWHDRLDDTFNTIMPKYLPMIDLVNKQFTKDFNANDGGYEITRNNSNTQTGEQDTTTDNTSKYSDTPQGAITGLLADKYLTSATINNTKNTYNGSTTTTVQDNEIRTDNLSTPNTVSLIAEYNEKILTIDQMIYKDCDSLFMGVW